VAQLIVTPQILARLVAIVIAGVLLQLSFFSGIHLFNTSPDVLPALVVVLGLLGGSMTGAVAGFSVGLLVDCLLVVPLGASSLTPPLMCLGLTLFAEAAFAAVRLMLGIDAPISALVVRDMVVMSIYAFFLGIPIYAGVRRALRPALITERPSRGRTGMLGA
jgi:hypothetical protein